MAESPCALLGIVSIFEYKKPSSYSEYWWKLEEKKFFLTHKRKNHLIYRL